VPTYIQLLALTPEGRVSMLQNPEVILQTQATIQVPGVIMLGLYGVLGEYDFVNILEAPDNDAVARYSLELGVRAGVRVVTMPAIPISRFEYTVYSEPPGTEAHEALPIPDGGN